MKVWVGIHASTNLVDTWRNIECVFDDEVKALLWMEDPEFQKSAQKWTDGTEMEWREYQEFTVL